MNLEDTVKSGVFFCAKGTSQAEMLVFLFGAARESEKFAKRISHDCKKIKKELEVDHEKDVSSSRCAGSYHRCGGCSMQEPQEIYNGKKNILGGIEE